MAIKNPPERAAAARYPSPVHRRKKLIQRSIRLLVNERKDALGIVFQNRAAAAPRFRCTYPMITPTLQPLDRTAGTDFKALGRLTSRRSRLHCLDKSFAQVTRQRFRHPRSSHSESMPTDSSVKPLWESARFKPGGICSRCSLPALLVTR